MSLDNTNDSRIFWALAECASVLIWMSNAKKECVYFNKAWLSFRGRTLEEECGFKWAEGVHPDDFDRCLEIYNRAFDAREPFSMDYRLMKHDGEYRWIRDDGAPVFNSDGKFQGYIGSCYDITEIIEANSKLKVAVDQTQKASKAKDLFLASVSHELRTPMHTILGYTEIALEGETDEAQKERLSQVQQAGEVLLHLIDDLLDSTRISQDGIKIMRAPTNIRELLEEVESMNLRLLKDRPVKLVCEVAENVPRHLMLDKNRIRQILMNLVGNAAKFTEQGEIRVTLEQENDVLKICVSDTGCGIAPEFLPHIYETFTQENSSGGYSGTGLGLSITKRLVDLMDGEISVESRLNSGSSFTLQIPARGCALDVSRSPETGHKSESLRGLSILVAEDNPASGILLESILQKAGARVKTVSNGQEALEQALEEEFDIILMDCRMPVMDGLEAARRIRAGEVSLGRCPTKIMALTANAFDSDATKCLAVGMDAHLTKPIKRGALLQAIASQAPKGERKLIDTGAVMDLLESLGKESFLEYLDKLHQSTERGLKEALDAARTHNARQLAEALHLLRGSVGNAGFKEACLLTESLEKSVLAGEFPSEQALTQLKDMMDSSFVDLEMTINQKEHLPI